MSDFPRMAGLEDIQFDAMGDYSGTLDKWGKKIKKEFDKLKGSRDEKKKKEKEKKARRAAIVAAQIQQQQQRAIQRQAASIKLGVGSFAAVAVVGFILLRALR